MYKIYIDARSSGVDSEHKQIKNNKRLVLENLREVWLRPSNPPKFSYGN